MGGGKGSAPPPPDYSALAKEQGAANVQAARQTASLSNPNIVSPWAKQNVTYSTQYTKPEPVKPVMGGTQMTREQAQDYVTNQMGIKAGSAGQRDRWGNTTGSYDQSVNDVLAGKVQGAGSYVDQDAYKKAMDQYNKDYADYQASAMTTPTVEQGFGSPEQEAAWKAQQTANQRLAELGVNSIGRVEDVMGKGFNYTGPGLQTSLGNAGDIGSVNMQQYGQAGGGPSASDYQATGQVGNAGDIQRGIGDQGPLARGLDTSNLAAMPVNAGMTGQQAIMSRLQPQVERERSQLQTQLANQGITPGSEAYRNAMTEQNQRENDLMTQAASQGLNLDFAARQQGFGEAQAGAGFQNQAQQQAFQQAMLSGQFGNEAQQQAYNQLMGAAQFGNQAAAQNFAQGQAAQQMSNAALGQNQQTALAQMQANNAAQNQRYNQNLQSAQFGNTADEQNFQRQLGLYNLPLNQVSALMSGSQVALPQFQGYQGAGVTASPIFQAGQAQNQYNMDVYNANVAQNNATMGAIGNVAGAGMMAFAM